MQPRGVWPRPHTDGSTGLQPWGEGCAWAPGTRGTPNGFNDESHSPSGGKAQKPQCVKIEGDATTHVHGLYAEPHRAQRSPPPAACGSIPRHCGALWGRGGGGEGAVREGATCRQVHMERVFTEKYIDVRSLKGQIQSLLGFSERLAAIFQRPFFPPVFAHVSPCYSCVVIMAWPC